MSHSSWCFIQYTLQPTFHIFHISRLVFHVPCPVYVSHFISHLLASHISCPMFHIPLSLCNIIYSIFHLPYPTFYILRVTFHVPLLQFYSQYSSFTSSPFFPIGMSTKKSRQFPRNVKHRSIYFLQTQLSIPKLLPNSFSSFIDNSWAPEKFAVSRQINFVARNIPTKWIS